MTNINATGYENLTVAGTAVSLTPVPSGARYALIYVQGGPISWRSDGTDATAADGSPVAVGERIDLTGPDMYQSVIAKASFIRTTGTSATLRVAYFA